MIYIVIGLISIAVVSLFVFVFCVRFINWKLNNSNNLDQSNSKRPRLLDKNGVYAFLIALLICILFLGSGIQSGTILENVYTPPFIILVALVGFFWAVKDGFGNRFK